MVFMQVVASILKNQGEAIVLRRGEKDNSFKTGCGKDFSRTSPTHYSLEIAIGHLPLKNPGKT